MIYLSVIMMTKEKVFDTLKKDKWLSTNQVAKTVGVNWYKAEKYLEKLTSQGKARKDKRSSAIFWKKK